MGKERIELTEQERAAYDSQLDQFLDTLLVLDSSNKTLNKAFLETQKKKLDELIKNPQTKTDHDFKQKTKAVYGKLEALSQRFLKTSPVKAPKGRIAEMQARIAAEQKKQSEPPKRKIRQPSGRKLQVPAGLEAMIGAGKPSSTQTSAKTEAVGQSEPGKLKGKAPAGLAALFANGPRKPPSFLSKPPEYSEVQVKKQIKRPPNPLFAGGGNPFADITLKKHSGNEKADMPRQAARSKPEGLNPLAAEVAALARKRKPGASFQRPVKEQPKKALSEFERKMAQRRMKAELAEQQKENKAPDKDPSTAPPASKP